MAMIDRLRRLFGGVRAETVTAPSSEPWLDALMSRQTSAGVYVSPTRAMQIVAVMACVRVIAEDVAKLPLHVFERSADGRERFPVPDHPVARLLRFDPNNFQNGLEFREMLTGHAVLRGNGYSFVNRVGGRVNELIPMRPDLTEVRQLGFGGRLAYRYRLPSPDNGVLELADDQILHLRWISNDGITGLSPVGLHREALGQAVATEDHGSTIFKNDAAPRGVLTHPGQLHEETAKRIEESWQRNYGGDNRGRIAVLEDGLTYTPVSMTNEDAQFLENRKFNRSEIASMFRVPPHKIGDLERATFSNIEQQSIEYVVDTLLSWLRRWESIIERRLFTPAERRRLFVKHNVTGLLRGEAEKRANFYNRAIMAGWMSPNEVRALEDMNPRDGGDEFLVASNLMSGEDLGGARPPGSDN